MPIVPVNSWSGPCPIWATFRCARAKTSISATSPPSKTAPTFRAGTRWSTAAGPVMLVTKRADASTLSVVNEVKASLPRMKAVLPPDIDLRFEFDQSPYVTQAIQGVAKKACWGRFDRPDGAFVSARWRSVIVVVLNIPSPCWLPCSPCG